MSPVPPRIASALRPLVVAAFATTVLAAPSAASAAPSKIAYGCGPEICVVDPDSGATAAITTDGAARPYAYPSLSADGTRLAALRGQDVVAGPTGNLAEVWESSRSVNDVALSPDGTAVLESHAYVQNEYGCPFTGGCLVLVDKSGSSWSRGAQGVGGFRRLKGGGGVGWLGSAVLSSSYTLGDDRHTVCATADPAPEDPTCRVVATETGRGLGDPAGSSDGRLVAAVRTAAGAPAQVVLYDAATTAEVRVLAEGTAPSFSPDAKQVAYQDTAGGISIIPTAGGKPRRVVPKGTSPSWSGGAGPGGGSGATGASVTSSSLRYRSRKIRVTVRCAGKATCRGTLRIKKGTTVLGSRSYRVKAGKRATVTVSPTRAGRRSLARSRKHAVVVRLEPKGGTAVTRKATVRR